MDPVTMTVIAVLASLGMGFAAGWGIRPDAAIEALEHQAQAIDTIMDGQTEILTEVSKPVVIDAELRATLAEVPVQCRSDMGGDPTSVECQWATCLQFGQSSAQRPECREVEKMMVLKMGPGCPDQEE